MESVDCLLTYGKPEADYSSYIFYINFISDNECTISHTFGDIHYYLVCDDMKTVKFVKTPTENNEKFVYLISDNKLRLFKRVLHKKYDERTEVVDYYEKLYTLHCTVNDNNEGELIVVDGEE